MNTVQEIIDTFRALTGEVDAWFNGCLQAGGSRLACRAGCSGCCRALFDITLLDAWMLKDAFSRLAGDVRQRVLARCRPRLAELRQRWPELQPPYLLNSLPEDEWLAMPEDDPAPCPLLDDSGHCLVYQARPLVCRLHGLPNIDLSGEDFEGTVCTLHPGEPRTVLSEGELTWHFRKCFEREAALQAALAEKLEMVGSTGLDTFIPLALLADYECVDWRAYWSRR